MQSTIKSAHGLHNNGEVGGCGFEMEVDVNADVVVMGVGLR